MAPVTVFRRISLLFLAVCFIANAHSARSAEAAQAYIVVDSQSGYILQSREPEQKRQVGSLTKVATASVVLDWAEHKGGDLNRYAAIPKEAFVGAVENSIGFQPGDKIQLRDLLYAALVQSDNIAAFTLGAYVGEQLQGSAPAAPGSKQIGSVDIFVGQMNALAKTLKMEKTRFVNPSGIDDKVRPMPYSTAKDMARLTRYAMEKASFRFYVSQKEREISFSRNGKQIKYKVRNTNELLGRNGIDGVKTGRTAHAGDCLILHAVREPEIVQTGGGTRVTARHLIVVLLGSTNRFGEGAGLVEQGWKLHEQWVAGGRMAVPENLL